MSEWDNGSELRDSVINTFVNNNALAESSERTAPVAESDSHDESPEVSPHSSTAYLHCVSEKPGTHIMPHNSHRNRAL